MLEDEHAIEFSSSAVEHKVVGHIYVEHLGGVGSEFRDGVDVGVGNVVGQDGVGSGVHFGVGSAVGQEVAPDEGDGEDGEENESDDSVAGVHFDDSEEERTMGLDDGFGGEGISAVGRRMRKKTVSRRRQAPRVNPNVNVLGCSHRGLCTSS
ncbi:hypothetical protein SESBI_08678 [Sesbania bispinosa]|nr:hypothetical protein SESBI_08678 [Sesbania bispinosa]